MKVKDHKCVYCDSLPGVTQDHVPPKSFFPKPRPDDLIKVPACRSCNEGAAKDEELFLATFMFTEAGISDAGKKLWDEKLHRMYRKNPGLKKHIARSLQDVNLVTSSGIHLGKRLAIRHEEARSKKVIDKIIRGLYHFEYQESLPQSIEITIHFLQEPSEITTVVEKINPMLLNGSRRWPDIFEYRFNRVAEQPEGSVWVIRFFGTAVFWATSKNRNIG